MVKGWDTVRLGFLKHLRMRANIRIAKEALGVYEHEKIESTKFNCFDAVFLLSS